MSKETPKTSERKSKNRQEKISRSAIVRPYRIVMAVGVSLFLGLIGYMVYFQVFKSEELLNRPENKRQDKVEAQVIRGSILASDGTTVLAETQVDGDGVEKRVYPFGSLFAHTVGYQVYGGSGLESTQNNSLIRSHANLVTQMEKELQEEKKNGDSLITTFDPKLQQAASDALGANRGAVVVMDPSTGKVLADFSSPSFDPNAVEQNWELLTQDDNGVFLNRGMQGIYPPGSTFKMVTALAYLRQYGTFDGFHYDCGGEYENSGFTIHCAGHQAHGSEDFAAAMANSCNCAFAYMATNLIDKDNLRKAAEDLGFNKDFDLDLPYTMSEFSMDANTANQLTMQTAIGQGDTLATPMQICMIAQAIANNGTMMKPYFVDRVLASDGTEVSRTDPKAIDNVMTMQQANLLKQIMKGVVSQGTASPYLGDLSYYDIAGKTGTAEYGDIANDTAHSWFVGFSNTGSNDIVVCVLVEGGGNGVAPAANVARNIFTTHFE
uniref:peptidoglycan D,D-transpeptidase FtsI family protein n=1 Tax=Eubacterium cellulosolvens TaxID=29322 RepID=UPI000685E607|nr:penicillin-binding transpeptidase domain-containing protein [[Eubacterium] cellulosolvens]